MTSKIIARRLAMIAFMAGCSTAAFAQNDVEATANAPLATANDSGDIVVTARRRSESLQAVPVSVTALDSTKLANATVQSLNDLTALAPGLRMSSEGGGGVSTLSLRGLSKTPVGETLPAVVVYFAEVALPNQGVDVPTYDLENIQVLKGPQGTLFGRNTLGGAILMTPRAPGDEFEGYAKLSVGDFFLRSGEAAVTIPIARDLLSVRFAGQIRRRDATIKNVDGGPDFRNVRQESGRATVQLTPGFGITNTTIVDYFHANEVGNLAIVYKDQSAQFLPLLGAGYVDAISAGVKQQAALGPFAAHAPIDNMFTQRESLGVVNNTRMDLSDSIYVKNIFGYRWSKLALTNPSDGLPPLVPAAGGPGLDLLTGGLFSKRELWSNELQLAGSLLDNRVDFIVGGIYTLDRPVGSPNGNYGSRFQIGGTPPPSAVAPALSSFIRSKSYAAFGQLGIDLSDWLVEGLKLNAGYRHSWDNVRACGTSNPNGFVDQAECERIAALNLVDGTGIIRAKGNEPSYTIGLDYKISPTVMAYVAHRRGYRGVNVNSPLFESPYLTGGAIPPGAPVCTLPSGPVTCPDVRAFQTTEPEKLTDVEIGLKTTWRAAGMRGRFNVAAYHSKLKNLVQFLNTGDLGVPSSAPDRPQSGALGINVADQTVRGVEVDATIQPVAGLTLGYSGSYVHHKIDSVRFPSIGSFNFAAKDVNRPTPEWSGTVTASYEVPIDSAGTQLVFNADYYHSSSYRPQSGVPLPGYEVANGRIDLRNIAGRNIDVGLWVKNAFNEKYLDAPIVISPLFPIASGLYGEQRTFGVDLTVRFGR